MDRERTLRAIELCRQELAEARRIGSHDLARYWRLQLREREEWLRRLAGAGEP
jgi:hypothetical protein